MNTDPMRQLLADIRTKAPQLVDVVNIIEETYLLTSMPRVEADLHFIRSYPPGHYYSPLPSLQEVASVAHRVFGQAPAEIPGLDLREREQLKLYARLLPLYKEMPFDHERQRGLRYYFKNDFFCQADAYFLYALLRDLQPKTIIEIGSGFSSAVMLDTDERFLGGKTKFTFIEPYPDRLHELLTPADRARVTIDQRPVQNVPLETFDQLEANDLLFIDSSHVGKIGSDVLHELFQILPRLKPGVVVHFHDVFYPFEYPRGWVENAGRAWNEAYFLRAFLQYNSHFEVLLFNDWLGKQHKAMLEKNTPLCLEDTGGSLYVRRVKQS